MCYLAQNNNETLMKGTDPLSCNSWPHDDYKGWVPVPRPNCDDYRMRWYASGFTWSEFERPFLKEDFCPEMFFYGTMLRHPVSLAKSIVNYHDIYQATHSGSQWARYMACLENKQAGKHAACVDSLEWLPNPSAIWMYFDNYLVRLFGGLEVWNLPPGTVNATHRQLALDQLSKFDLVLTVEQFSSNETRSVLARTFGWSSFWVIDMHVRDVGHSVLEEFSEADTKRIEKLNSHDMIIYEALREREAARNA